MNDSPTADKLTSRERRVFEARVLADQPMTLEELAAEFGIARVRVRQIEARALEKMGHRMQRSTETTMMPADQILLALEQVFCEADDGSDVWCATIDEMIITSAVSLDGIRAKARVACSNRLGDLEEAVLNSSAPYNDQTLENSILRDLIRLYDPHLERKGAVQALAASLG
jgi:Sigma-70, region 4